MQNHQVEFQNPQVALPDQGQGLQGRCHLKKDFQGLQEAPQGLAVGHEQAEQIWPVKQVWAVKQGCQVREALAQSFFMNNVQAQKALPQAPASFQAVQEEIRRARAIQTENYQRTTQEAAQQPLHLYPFQVG